MNDERRKLATRTIQAIVDYGVAVAVVAAMLRVSRQEVYRWLSGGWLPREKMCEPIDKLLRRVEVVKADWEAVARTWDMHIHEAVALTLYKPAARKILLSSLDDAQKIRQLTSLTFATWAERGKK